MGEVFSKWNKSVPRYDELQQFVVDSIHKSDGDQFSCLEIGVGLGGTAHHLLKKFPKINYVGIDTEQESVHHCKDLFRSPESCDFLVADIREYAMKLPVDVIVSVLTLHHLNHSEKVSVLEKLHTNMNDGGFLIIGDLVKLEDPKANTVAKSIFDDYRASVLDDEELDKVKQHIKNYPHEFETVRDMWQLLTDAGFSKIDLIWMYHRLGVFRAVKL